MVTIFATATELLSEAVCSRSQNKTTMIYMFH